MYRCLLSCSGVITILNEFSQENEHIFNSSYNQIDNNVLIAYDSKSN